MINPIPNAKTISTFTIWLNGQNVLVSLFNLVSIADNLSTMATFNYGLYSSDYTKVSEGNLTMEGFDYQQWDIDPNANEWAYNWAINKLNLTAVPTEIIS